MILGVPASNLPGISDKITDFGETNFIIPPPVSKFLAVIKARFLTINALTPRGKFIS